MALSKITLGVVSGIAVVAASVGTVAAFSGKGQSVQTVNSTQELREKFTVPTHVQLKPFLAPIQG